MRLLLVLVLFLVVVSVGDSFSFASDDRLNIGGTLRCFLFV